jgi:hypothetical protein
LRRQFLLPYNAESKYTRVLNLYVFAPIEAKSETEKILREYGHRLLWSDNAGKYFFTSIIPEASQIS